MQAVEYVAREFGNADLVSDWNFGSRAGSGTYEGMSDEARVEEGKNTAGKYRRSSKCLITLPSAGKARTHLRTRNLSPVTIHTFAIGYAPDCYYGDEAKMSKTISDTKNSNSWGAGSLLEYLAGTGFSPDKIVEAGLAVRTKRQQSTPGADSIHQLSSRTELKTNNNVNIQV